MFTLRRIPHVSTLLFGNDLPTPHRVSVDISEPTFDGFLTVINGLGEHPKRPRKVLVSAHLRVPKFDFEDELSGHETKVSIYF